MEYRPTIASDVQFVVPPFPTMSETSVEEGEAVNRRRQDPELHTRQTHRGKLV